MRPRWLPWILLALGVTIVAWSRRRTLAALVAPETPSIATVQALEPPRFEDDGSSTLPPMVPSDLGICPQTHLVKANPTSRIYHLPHHRMYARLTNAVCYVDTEAAEREGYRASKQ